MFADIYMPDRTASLLSTLGHTLLLIAQTSSSIIHSFTVKNPIHLHSINLYQYQKQPQ